jgi:SWI/SNF-related matrix-associated actin-dependent regulator of chromatin subfamily A member 5
LLTFCSKACGEYGRSDIDQICKAVTGRDDDVVKRYAEHFFAESTPPAGFVPEPSPKGGARSPKKAAPFFNYMLIQGWKKHLQAIDKGEERIRRQAEMREALAEKVQRYDNPWAELRIPYSYTSGVRGRQYSEDEDVFLVCAAYEVGYGFPEKLRLCVRRSWQFKFDWFFKSRTAEELQRRLDSLLRLIVKENADLKAKRGRVADLTASRRAAQRKLSDAGGPTIETPTAATKKRPAAAQKNNKNTAAKRAKK